MHQVFEEAGMPVEPEKNEGPVKVITFLGLQLDTNMMEIWLPHEKLRRLKELVTSWTGKKAGKKRYFLSHLGLPRLFQFLKFMET